MKNIRPGILSVRAVNQYRRRDVLAYLSLRYYLNNSAARKDHWARNVATGLVLTRTNLPYFGAHHFKEVTGGGDIEHRQIFLPGANEALAEAALLDECANHSAFANPKCVFSYNLSQGEDRSGVFQYYPVGLEARHKAITEACEAFPKGLVRYTDIKRFYPSIQKDLAIRAWSKQSDIGKLPKHYRDLGEKLINDHVNAGNISEDCILTGPMFSHLLGNLVLRELDDEFSKTLPARYFRYVDDITLVGDSRAVDRAHAMVRQRLKDIGFRLHDDSSPKCMEVPTKEWLIGRNDFRKSRRSISWMTLVGDLKKFLLLNSGVREELCSAFRNEGFRIPVRDYTGAVHEASYLAKVLNWAKHSWFRQKSQSVTIQSLLEQARWLRKSYEEQFLNTINNMVGASCFARKRHIPMLRYRAARLIYLATDDRLAALSPIANELPELHFHAKVMEAVATGNIDSLLPLGTNAAQATAQPLRASEKQAVTTLQEFSEAEEQALAVFLLNGVTVNWPMQGQREASELMRFATVGSDLTLMKTAEPFIREASCLHGLTEQPRHPELLETVFDEDEALAMDAIDQLQQSLSP